MGSLRYPPLILLCLTCTTGCYHVPQNHGHWMTSTVRARSGYDVYWAQDHCEEECLQRVVNGLLRDRLSVDAAIQIALLNNPSLQATFEEIGIARADLIQATLFTNPLFGASIRYPHSQAQFLNTELSLMTSLLDLFLMPICTKIASLNLRQTEVHATNKVLQLITEVQTAFYSLQAEQEALTLQKEINEVTEIAKEIANKQYEAGNINHTTLEAFIADDLQSKLETTAIELTILRLKEELNRLMGLCGPATCWDICSSLPPTPEEETPQECLEEIALKNRLDLEAARIEVRKLARTGTLHQWWRYTETSAGVSSEKEIEGVRVTGPVVELEVPLFNSGQADRARLLAELRQSQQRYIALEVDVLSEVRLARDSMLTLRNRAMKYEQEALPARKEMLDSAQKLYNVMNAGVYELLHLHQKILENKIAYGMALRDYWMSRAHLDRAIGGPLLYVKD